VDLRLYYGIPVLMRIVVMRADFSPAESWTTP